MRNIRELLARMKKMCKKNIIEKQSGTEDGNSGTDIGTKEAKEYVMADIKRLKERYFAAKETGKRDLGQETLVSIIVLNRNGRSHLETLMRSFASHQFYQGFEIICIDNASTDDSVAYMESWNHTYSITMVQNKENMTFSAANNLGAQYARGDYLLFLNNDTEVTDGWLDELLLTMQSTDRPGAIGAKLVYPEIPDGTSNEGKSYTIQHEGISFKDVTRDKTHFIQPYNMGNGKIDAEMQLEPQERICVTAAVMLIKRTVFDAVGGFDERYVYGYEDVDLCMKLHRAGYKNYVCPCCLVFHYEFGTQKQDDTQEKKQRRLHNMYVFKGKWQRYLSKQLFEDKLSGRGLFTEQTFMVAFAVSTRNKKVMAEDYVKALELKAALEARGCKVKFLNGTGKKDWYQAGVNADALIAMTPEYEMKNVYRCKCDLIRHVWNAEDESVQADAWVETFLQKIAHWFDVPIEENEIDICGAMPDDESKKFWGDWHFALGMKRELERRSYRVNVLPRDLWYAKSAAKYVIVLRGKRPYYRPADDDRKYIMWNISHPEDVTISEYDTYDYVFFASDKMQHALGSKIHVPSSVLLQCVDDTVMTYKETGEKRYELLFVGNSREVYRPILKDLLPTERKLSVYGRGWEPYPVQAYVENDYLDNTCVGQAYHDAKILLNDHWDDMRENGIISNRIFDALAVGAFVISDDMPELEALFEGNVVTYKDREDLKEKIDYYLTHDEEREAKAKAGQQIVLAGHTFRDRAAEMDHVIRERI